MNLLKLNNDKLSIDEAIDINLAKINAIDHYDLKTAFANSWNQVKGSLGLSYSYLIGRNIRPYNASNRIDLLAYDIKSNSINIIDFNNGESSHQLLQLMFYSVILGQWENSDLINCIQTDINIETEKLLDVLGGRIYSGNVSIIMLSEKFDPKIIRYIQSQRNLYSLNVSAFSLTEYKVKDDIFLSIKKEVPDS